MAGMLGREVEDALFMALYGKPLVTAKTPYHNPLLLSAEGMGASDLLADWAHPRAGRCPKGRSVTRWWGSS